MGLIIPKERQINETEEFKIFSVELDYISEFFSSLSELIYSNGKTIWFTLDKKIYTLDTSLLESSSQTLKSIKLCSSIGSFSDANTLIRKLRDDLLQYIYILTIIEQRKPFSEESVNDIKTDNAEEFTSSIFKLQYNNILSDDEQAVSAWFNNTVAELKHSLKKKLEFENYMTVIKQNSNISHILSEYKLQEYWEKLRRRLNDYVHSNGISYSRHNHILVGDKNLETHLKNISFRTSYVASFFTVVLLMVKSSLISSTDFINHLDCNMEPPEGSQYFVASFVQDFIDKKVTTIHPELKQYLKDNNINGMKID